MVHQILLFFTGLGYWGVMFGLMIIIIPSEIVLAYAGYLVYNGNISFVEAFIFGLVGGTIAQIFVYWVGRYGGRPFLDKFGKYLLIKQSHVELSEAWFIRYGRGVVFTARFVPVVHHAISIPAGMARMRLGTFTLYTMLGLAPWTALFIYLGRSLGENYENISAKAAPYVWPLIWIAVGITALYFIYMLLFRKISSRQLGGHYGEKHTADVLNSISGDYSVLHSKFISSRGAAQEIDHLVVGPNGLFHIETKNWPGLIRFTEKGMEQTQPDHHHEEPTAALYRHEFILKELLRAHKIEADVVGLLNFSTRIVRSKGKVRHLPPCVWSSCCRQFIVIRPGNLCLRNRCWRLSVYWRSMPSLLLAEGLSDDVL